MAQDGRHVAGDVHLALAVADDDAAGVAQPRRNQAVGMAPAEHDDRARPLQIGQRLAHGQLEVAGAAVVIVAVDEVDDDLGVGVALEDVALILQLLAQFQEVLDDPVLHHDQVAVGAAVRVGVAAAGRPVRGPARVTHPNCTLHRVVGQQLLQVAQLARLAPHLDAAAAVDHGQPGRVVTAVFQLAQPVHDDRRGIRRSDITNDSTHDEPSHGC